MSEPARQPAPPVVRPVEDPLATLLPPVRAAEADDIEARTAPRVGERVGFEIPAGIWSAMVACYGVFLSALLVATRGAHAAFMIAISTFYVIMFFGTSRVMLRHAPAQPRGPLERTDGVLQTIYGPLGRSEVLAQMLVVPMAIAFFGIAILAIRLAVF